jgi:hypothetical protein
LKQTTRTSCPLAPDAHLLILQRAPTLGLTAVAWRLPSCGPGVARPGNFTSQTPTPLCDTAFGAPTELCWLMIAPDGCTST